MSRDQEQPIVDTRNFAVFVVCLQIPETGAVGHYLPPTPSGQRRALPVSSPACSSPMAIPTGRLKAPNDPAPVVSDLQVISVHEDVGAALQFFVRPALPSSAKVPRTGTTHDFTFETGTLQHVDGFTRGFDRATVSRRLYFNSGIAENRCSPRSACCARHSDPS